MDDEAFRGRVIRGQYGEALLDGGKPSGIPPGSGNRS